MMQADCDLVKRLFAQNDRFEIDRAHDAKRLTDSRVFFQTPS